MIETPTFSHFVKNIVHRASCGVEIIGATADAGSILELINRYQPDVLIVDIRNASSGTFELLMKIRSENPYAQIIGRTKKPAYQFMLQVIGVGVMGFVNDQTPFNELIDAIGAVGSGYAYLPQNLASQFVQGLQYQPS